ncbi:hypothetical protein JYU01_01130 [bacterium AH-315-L21]|nr:hypothetical protein [bacterium AH-315-L21]
MNRIINGIFMAILIMVVISSQVLATNMPSFKTENFKEILKTEISQKLMLQEISKIDLEENVHVIHNNGKAIKSDFFTEGKNEGNYLIAVTYISQGNTINKTVHFANKNSLTQRELDAVIHREVKLSRAQTGNPHRIQVQSASSSIIETYSWSFFEGSTLGATLRTNVTSQRMADNAIINGVPGSVWDVTSFSQLEKVNGTRLNNKYTRLSVDLTNQELLSFGPAQSTSGGTVSFSLSGGGVPSASYSFNIDGFSVVNLSSLSRKYGRWKFVDHFGSEPQFVTDPGIRATNTSGSFIVELSHTASVTYNNTIARKHRTGVIQIHLPDR